MSSSSSKIFNKNYLAPSSNSSSPFSDVLVWRQSDTVPEPTGTTLGRETLYEATLVCSPVLGSTRIHHQQNLSDKAEKVTKKRLISAADVDELAMQLNTMRLGPRKVTKDATATEVINKTTVETRHEHKDPTQATASTKKVCFANIKPNSANHLPVAGRFHDTVFSTKAKGNVTVKRSVRLARN